MLSFILTLALIGGLIGLIFSRKGKEGEDMLRGAKKGAELGCSLGCLLPLFLLVLGTAILGTLFL